MSLPVLVARASLTWEARVETLIMAVRTLHDRGFEVHLYLRRGPERDRALQGNPGDLDVERQATTSSCAARDAAR